MFSYRVCLLTRGITTSGRIRQCTLEINALFLWECPEPDKLELSRVSFGIFFSRPKLFSLFSSSSDFAQEPKLCVEIKDHMAAIFPTWNVFVCDIAIGPFYSKCLVTWHLGGSEAGVQPRS